MKAFFTALFATLSLFLNVECSGNFTSGKKLEEKEILLTYPKSGTNLTLGIVQILTHKPVKTFEPCVVNRLDLDLDQAKAPLWRAHETKYLRNVDPNKSKLLVVLRNYKECIVRNEKQIVESQNYNANQLRNCIVKNHGGFQQYIDNLSYYNRWPNENTKLLIYYEDLITQPEIEIPKIMALFNEEDVDLEGFFANYDSWMEKILGSYKKQHGAQYSSGGDKQIFHSKGFPLPILKEIDQHIKKSYPILWQRYLSRYETSTNIPTPNAKALF